MPLKLTPAKVISSLMHDLDSVQDSVLRDAVSPIWLVTMPSPIRDSLRFRRSHKFPLPKPPVIIILYAGPDDATSLESAIHSVAPWLTEHVIAVELLRGVDMLAEEPYSTLCTACIEGKVAAVIGGPNCRTWSIRRHIPKPNGGSPVRGRLWPTCWGLDNLEPQAQRKVDGDNTLLCRQITLMHLAYFYEQRTCLFLEHPEDPDICSRVPNAKHCSSIWVVPEVAQFIQTTDLKLYSFDQCRMGQVVPKTTKVATNLPLKKWKDLYCNHRDHCDSGITDSSSLSRWPWEMNLQIARALARRLDNFPGFSHDRPAVSSKLVLSEGPGALGPEPGPHPPDVVRVGFKHRPLRDGGGKPSLGRWNPKTRPAAKLAGLGAAILAAQGQAHSLVKDSLARQDKFQPFPTELIEEVRCILGTDHSCTPGQPFLLDLLSSLAHTVSDPDWEFPLQCKQGMPLGVLQPMDRTPNIWPTKLEMAGDSYDKPSIPELKSTDNYLSAKLHYDTLQKTFEEEQLLGMCRGPLTLDEAAAACGCNADEIICGALGAVEEADKIRTIYDGTVGGQNDRIQDHILEKTTSPTLHDAMHAIHWVLHNTSEGASGPESRRGEHDLPSVYLLKADVTKAHRRIMIRQNEWRFQVAKIHSHYWINMVGTYGMASAQFHWGRMAALLIRILYHLFPQIHWIFVYVDDFAFVLTEQHWELTSAALLVLIALGCPLSWHKTALGTINTWLGFQIQTNTPTAQVGPKKLPIILSLLEAVHRGDNISKQVLHEILGRLQWATASTPFLRPFLQPWWEWFQAVQTSGRPSQLIRSMAVMFRDLLATPYKHISPWSPMSEWWGSSDASADDEQASIGGWITNETSPEKSRVWWFSSTVSKQTLPWIFDKQTPQRRISTLEMLGTLTLFQHLLLFTKGPGASGPKENLNLHIPLMTDNQGNALSILNNNSKKWPTSAVLMELVMQAHIHEVAIGPMHIKRSRNTWADALAGMDHTGFDQNKRLPALLPEYWHILGPTTGLLCHYSDDAVLTRQT